MVSETRRPIYLDYNATTPHDPEVVEAMRPFLETEYGNPSSSHAYGEAPRSAVARARAEVAALMNAPPERILFTSGGTESNNYAIIGVALARKGRGNHIITSTVEHPAVANTCDHLEREGFAVTRVPVDQYGMVNPNDVEKAMRPETILITVMHANNEIGTIEAIREIAAIASARDVLIHTDAAQSLGKIPVDVEELGVDLLTVAGHKLYAPKGVGALYVGPGVHLEPLMYGGGQEGGRRPGTENVLEIVGLGAACRIALRDLETNRRRMQQTRDRLYQKLSAACEVRLNGHPEKRLPNTLNVSFRGITSNDLIAAVADRITVSAGSACHAGTVSLSPVIEAIGTPREWGRGTIRFSTGKYTTEDEIDQAVAAVIAAFRARGFFMARTEPFDELSEAYDDWFVRFAPVYESELSALRAVVPSHARGVEVGVGSGRFAAPLGVEVGVEPSKEMAKLARERGVIVYEGVAENLPLESETYDFALMVTTICFVDDPDRAIGEMARVIKKEGQLIFGLVDKDSPLGKEYQTHKAEDPFYRHATFLSTGELIDRLSRHGLSVLESFQTVFGSLGDISEPQEPRTGSGEGAFVVLVAGRVSWTP